MFFYIFGVKMYIFSIFRHATVPVGAFLVTVFFNFEKNVCWADRGGWGPLTTALRAMAAMSKFVAEGAFALAECIDALAGLFNAFAQLAPLMAEIKIICAVAGMVAIVYRLTEKREHAIVNAPEVGAAEKDLIVFVHTGQNDRKATKQFGNGNTYDGRCNEWFSTIHLEKGMPANGLESKVSEDVCREIIALASLVWAMEPSVNLDDGRALCSSRNSSSGVPVGKFAVQFAKLPANAPFGDMVQAKRAFEDMKPISWHYDSVNKRLVAVFLIVHHGCKAHCTVTDKLLQFAPKM